MFKGRSTIRVVTLVALVALAVVWLLPPEHLHPALAGRLMVIHRHAIVATAQQPTSSADHDHPGAHDHKSDPGDHGDHSEAQVLKTVFQSAPKVTPDMPVITQAMVGVTPHWHVVGHTDLRHEWTCHDPPDRPTSPRAPPA